MEKITDWQKTALLAAQQSMPIVLMVDQDHCPYCRRVESEFFTAIFSGGEFEGKAIFGKISIDDEEYIKSDSGKFISTREFLKGYDANFTPTILFLDSEKNELAEKLIGLTTPDYYGYYLEQAIRMAIKKAGPAA